MTSLWYVLFNLNEKQFLSFAFWDFNLNQDALVPEKEAEDKVNWGTVVNYQMLMEADKNTLEASTNPCA